MGPTGEHEKTRTNRPTNVPPTPAWQLHVLATDVPLTQHRRCATHSTTGFANRCGVVGRTVDSTCPRSKTTPALCQECRVFYIAFETTGLNVLTSDIPEIGVTEVRLFVNSTRICNAIRYI